MKRWPLVASFILFIALCASAAYWAMQLFKPPLRPVAAPPRAATAEVKPEAAAALFGGRGSKAAVASNYQLQGVIMAGTARDSVAILSADGNPAQAVRAEMEVVPGVTIKEVHREYVLLSEGGVIKRVELPDSAKDQGNPAISSPVPVQPTPAQRMPPPRPVAPPPPAVVNPPQPTPPMQAPQAPQTVVPGTMPPAPATIPGGVPGPQTMNPPPTPEPAPANPAALDRQVPGAMPPARVVPPR
jgi:general secretion pathway protein C